MMSYKISIFTCVYNRAHTIHRVFNSMKAQTYRNLEHIIVDDGSTDELDELVAQYIQEVEYPVKYFKKPNGGKHTATNLAWDNATGDFIIQLDSDDEFFPEAIEFLVKTYEAIPDKVKDEYWCVHGRCIDQIEHKMKGEPYPKGINEWPADEAKEFARNIDGDKVGLMKREKLEGWRYPEPEGVKFVPEGYLWFPINRLYRTWYTNEVVLIAYTNEGECLTKAKKNSQTCSNIAYYSKWLLENGVSFEIKRKAHFITLLKYVIYYELSTQKFKQCHAYRDNSLSKTDNLLLYLIRPFGKMACLYLRRRWKM